MRGTFQQAYQADEKKSKLCEHRGVLLRCLDPLLLSLQNLSSVLAARYLFPTASYIVLCAVVYLHPTDAPSISANERQSACISAIELHLCIDHLHFMRHRFTRRVHSVPPLLNESSLFPKHKQRTSRDSVCSAYKTSTNTPRLLFSFLLQCSASGKSTNYLYDLPPPTTTHPPWQQCTSPSSPSPWPSPPPPPPSLGPK